MGAWQSRPSPSFVRERGLSGPKTNPSHIRRSTVWESLRLVGGQPNGFWCRQRPLRPSVTPPRVKQVCRAYHPRPTPWGCARMNDQREGGLLSAPSFFPGSSAPSTSPVCSSYEA
jgi:hypothetical protein